MPWLLISRRSDEPVHEQPTQAKTTMQLWYGTVYHSVAIVYIYIYIFIYIYVYRKSRLRWRDTSPILPINVILCRESLTTTCLGNNTQQVKTTQFFQSWQFNLPYIRYDMPTPPTPPTIHLTGQNTQEILRGMELYMSLIFKWVAATWLNIAHQVNSSNDPRAIIVSIWFDPTADTSAITTLTTCI